MAVIKKKQVVILCGPRPGYGYNPLPPMTNSAPEKNIYRLAEFDYGPEIQITVISACGKSQHPKMDLSGRISQYINIPFPDWLYTFCRHKLFHTRLIESIINAIFNTYDLFSAIYLSTVIKRIKKISPDLILINSLPQYMVPIRRHFPKQKVGLFVRGEMGRSRKYLPELDLILTNSIGMAEYTKKLLNGVQVPIETIPNSLDKSFCKVPKDYRIFQYQVIYSGRIEDVKGVLELLMAFKIVQEQIHEAKLIIVGGNYKSGKLTLYEQTLLEYALNHELNINFTGEIPNDELSDYLLQADLAVFPSNCLESFGMVALEAMRCGLPVIASRRPGFEELVKENETGILIDDPKDISSLAKIIVNLLKDQTELKRMGKNGHSRSLDYLPEVTNTMFRDIMTRNLNLHSSPNKFT